jgi:hypothetical protein
MTTRQDVPGGVGVRSSHSLVYPCNAVTDGTRIYLLYPMSKGGSK